MSAETIIVQLTESVESITPQVTEAVESVVVQVVEAPPGRDGDPGPPGATTIDGIAGLPEALASKADTSAMTTALAGKADAEAMTTALSGKSDVSHNHEYESLQSKPPAVRISESEPADASCLWIQMDAAGNPVSLWLKTP